MVCVPDPAPCTTTEDCNGDFYCDTSASECLPFGVGPGGTSDDSCTRDVIPGVFFPDVQCEWLGPPAGDPYPDHTNVLGTPVVVNFRNSGDPELGRPSIVFITYNGDDGGAPACEGITAGFTAVIRVVDGRNCQQTANIDAPLAIPSSTLAVGDITGDGIADIVAARAGGGLAAWTLNATNGFDLLWQTTSTIGAGVCNWAGPSIHNLDSDDDRPEIMLHGAVFDADGNELTSALGTLTLGLGTGYVPVVAHMDDDAQPELVTGTAIFGWVAASGAWQLETVLGTSDANVAVADLGTFDANAANDDRSTLDGVPEIVTVGSGVVTVYTSTGRSIFSIAVPGGGFGGPPTIADFDGDGRAEFATAGGTAYSVFDLDCLGTPEPMTCPSLRDDGVVWSRPSQDSSSNRTGSSVFDFEGDGIAEAVYGDECFTRVYDGSTGDVAYSRYRRSCTWYENPVIADTDSDFGAEIIITSNTNCPGITCPAVDPIFDGVRCFDQSDCPGTTSCVREMDADALGRCRCTLDADCGGDGFVCIDPIAGPSPKGKVCRAANPGVGSALGIRVVGDQLGRWVATRPVWNQHGYAVTNVNDDGTIPRADEWQRNWRGEGLNNFRQNSPGDGAGAGLMPDLTMRNPSFTCSGGSVDIIVEACNRGTEPVADGVAVNIYDGSTLVCTTTTNSILPPGFCEEVTCTWDSPPSSATDLTAVVDNDATSKGEHVECRETNNLVTVPQVVCN